MKKEILTQIKNYISSTKSNKFKTKYKYFAKKLEMLTEDDIELLDVPRLIAGQLRILGTVTVGIIGSEKTVDVPCPSYVTKKFYGITENSIRGDNSGLLYIPNNRAIFSKLLSILKKSEIIGEMFSTDYDLYKELTRFFVRDCFEPECAHLLYDKYIDAASIRITGVENVIFDEKPTQKGITIKIKNNKNEPFYILLGYINEGEFTLLLDSLLDIFDKKEIYSASGGDNVLLSKGLFGWKICKTLYKIPKWPFL